MYGAIVGVIAGEPWSMFQMPYGVSQWPARTVAYLCRSYSTYARWIAIEPSSTSRPADVGSGAVTGVAGAPSALAPFGRNMKRTSARARNLLLRFFAK